MNYYSYSYINYIILCFQFPSDAFVGTNNEDKSTPMFYFHYRLQNE